MAGWIKSQLRNVCEQCWCAVEFSWSLSRWRFPLQKTTIHSRCGEPKIRVNRASVAHALLAQHSLCAGIISLVWIWGACLSHPLSHSSLILPALVPKRDETKIAYTITTVLLFVGQIPESFVHITRLLQPLSNRSDPPRAVYHMP
jgi:hypothetical protein